MQKATNNEVMEILLVPILFLTVALGGGLRFQVDNNALLFIRPQLISCIIGLFAVVLLARQGLIHGADYFGERHGLIGNLSGAVRIIAIYAATIQVFNLVTPERGFLGFAFNLFFLLILLNNFFVMFNPRRLTAALATVLGVSFLLKYVLLADLFAPTQSWGKYILQELMKAGSLGALDYQAFSGSTGYLAFFILALYVVGLYLIAPMVSEWESLVYKVFTDGYRLEPFERQRLLSAVAKRELVTVEVDPAVEEIGRGTLVP